APRGSLIASVYREDQPNAPNKVAIIPFAGGDPIKLLDIPQSFNRTAGLRWMPDGRTLTFIDTINGVSNIWSLPLDGGSPKQLTDFKTDQIFWFDFSRDGKQLALSRGTQTSDVILIRDFKCRSQPSQNSVAIKSARSWAQGGWERCTRVAIHNWVATLQ